MLGEQSQLLVLFGLALAVHAGVLYTVFRMSRAERARRVGPAAIERRPSDRTEETTVVCPSCGTENEAGYRFCRSCLTELPSWTNFEPERRNPVVPG